MANSIANVINAGATADAASYNTAAVTPAANALLLLVVGNSKAATPDIPTVSGAGLTWVQVATVTFSTAGSPTRRLTLFRAMGATPATGALTISFGGVTQTGCFWVLDQATGMSTGGTNGSAAVVQSITGTQASGVSTSFGLALAAFANTANSTYAAFAVATNNTFTEKSGYTELADNGNADVGRLQTEWIVSSDTAPRSTQAATSRNWGGIAIELAAAGTIAPAVPTAARVPLDVVGAVRQVAGVIGSKAGTVA